MRATKDASDTIAEAWSKDIRECARLEVLCEKLTKELAAERARRIKAENIMLLYRNGDEKAAQLAYLDYCGKYLGEPRRG